MADADNYPGGGGGNDWEVVSLTASTYAAAPSSVLPLLLDAHKKTELPPPPPGPPAASAIFMSQHFNLPVAEAHTDTLSGCQEQEWAPAMLQLDDDTDDLNMPCPQDDCQTEMLDDGLTYSDFLGDGNALQEVGGGIVSLAVEDLQTTVLCSPNAAGSDTRSTSADHVFADDAAADSASLPAHVVSSGVASVTANKGPSSKIPCEAHAWWNKTFSFLSNNSKESLTFRFIFVAPTGPGTARQVAAQA